MKEYIESLLQNGEFEYSTVPGHHSFYFSSRIQDFDATYAITINEEGGYLFYLILYPYDIPKDKLEKVAEFINRINYGDIYGAFILSYVDMSIGYHLSIPIGANIEENEKWFAEYLGHGQKVMEEFHEGLLDVLGGKDPYEVLREMGAAVTQVSLENKD